jgi:hypothetical protein
MQDLRSEKKEKKEFQIQSVGNNKKADIHGLHLRRGEKKKKNNIDEAIRSKKNFNRYLSS